MEEKKTPKTRNRDREAIRFRPPARLTRGRRRFSCLKPSRTHSIIRSVPRVRQSISRSSRGEGGVMTSAASAASRDSVSIISFFRKERIRFIMAVCLPWFPIAQKSRGGSAGNYYSIRGRALQPEKRKPG